MDRSVGEWLSRIKKELLRRNQYVWAEKQEVRKGVTQRSGDVCRKYVERSQIGKTSCRVHVERKKRKCSCRVYICHTNVMSNVKRLQEVGHFEVLSLLNSSLRFNPVSGLSRGPTGGTGTIGGRLGRWDGWSPLKNYSCIVSYAGNEFCSTKNNQGTSEGPEAWVPELLTRSIRFCLVYCYLDVIWKVGFKKRWTWITQIYAK